MANSKPMVLVADDTIHNLQYLGNVVEEVGYEPVLVTNGTQLMSFLKTEKPDIILLDVMMPDSNGFDLCEQIKASEDMRDIPIIFITAKNNDEDIIRGFDAGAVDYITKPFNIREFISRLKTHVELKLSRDKLKIANIEMAKMMQELERISKIDFLTGLNNRLSANERIEEELRRFERNRKVFTIVLADLDKFKKINDTYGHDAGDYVLKNVAEIFQKTVREYDIVARWGGEEFFLLLPETDLSGALVLIERIRKSLDATDFRWKGEAFANPVTLTFGVSAYDGRESIEIVISHADSALYAGKHAGRNRVECFE